MMKRASKRDKRACSQRNISERAMQLREETGQIGKEKKENANTREHSERTWKVRASTPALCHHSAAFFLSSSVRCASLSLFPSLWALPHLDGLPLGELLHPSSHSLFAPHSQKALRSNKAVTYRDVNV